MKNYLGRMVGASMGLSFDDAGAGGGGGAAVAAPPAAPAAAAPAAAPASDGGFFFRNIPQREVPEDTNAGKPAAAAPAAGSTAEKPFVVNDDAGNPIEGAAFATQAEAEAYIKQHAGTSAPEKTAAELAAEEIAALAGGDPATTAAPAAGAVKVSRDAVLETPIFGRFKTVAETEEYIKQSGAHAQKLDAENKKLKADNESITATRDAELAAVKAELKLVRETPAFKELTKEEYAELAKEDPGAAVDYRLAKRDNDEAIQRAKDESARKIEDRQKRVAAKKAEINRVVTEMEKDEKAYPMFSAVDPLMGKVHEAMGGDESPLNGDPRAVNLYYHAAMGRLYISLLGKGKVAKVDAADAAKKAAESAAAATAAAGAGGGGVPPKPKTAQEIANEKWSKGIEDAGNKKVFNFD